MGLFSFNYSKEGPGVDKDAPKKKGAFLYFEILGRKFFKLIRANALYFACSIPYLVLMYFLVVGCLGGTVSRILSTLKIDDETSHEVFLLFSTFITMSVFALWGSGPASASFSFITRSFTREEHTWILSDFFKIFKENFKQAIIVVIVDFVALFILVNAISIYWSLYISNGQIVFALLSGLCCMLMVIYTFMHFYIYQLMVTFNCKISQLYKNALLLSLGKAPMNLLLSAMCVGLLFILFNFINPVAAVIICFVIFMGLVRFPIEFYTARVIKKVAIDNK